MDQYGSSPQINNARLASTLHGTLTIAVLSIPSNSIQVVSLQKKIPGVITSLKRGRVNIIAQERGENINAVIGSGLQSDITFVVSLLRKHVSECWERYDSIPSLDRVTMDATEVMLCFMGYEVNEEIRDGTRGILNDSSNGEDETISIGRPLACNLLFLEVGKNSKLDMKLVDPGGIISESLIGRAIGQGYERANTLLRNRWRVDHTAKDLEELCPDIIRETVMEEGLLSDREMEHAFIVCEELTKEGLTIRRIPFLAQKVEDK